MISPDVLISALNKTDYYLTIIFTRGDCFKFYEFLKQLYPDAEPYLRLLDKNHVITKINGKYYDITGEIKNVFVPTTDEDIFPDNSIPYILMTDKDIKECKTWSFSAKVWRELE